MSDAKPWKRRPHKHTPAEVRFWAKVDKTSVGGCWSWTGGTNGVGYGALGIRLGPDQWEKVSAHRFSWSLAHGEIEPGVFVCHRCDNPRCVNPAHLFLGTHADNMRDRMERGRQARGERHGHSKLKPADVVLIRNERAAGTTAAALAERFGVSGPCVSRICTGKTWSYIGGPVTQVRGDEREEKGLPRDDEDVPKAKVEEVAF
jgi:hypothetical protein